MYKIDGTTITLTKGDSFYVQIALKKNGNTYVPQEGDQVIVTYDKDNMKLIDIQLEYRPVEVTE